MEDGRIDFLDLPRDIIFDIFDFLSVQHLNSIIKDIFGREAAERTNYSEKRIVQMLPRPTLVQLVSAEFNTLFNEYKTLRPAESTIIICNFYTKCCWCNNKIYYDNLTAYNAADLSIKKASIINPLKCKCGEIMNEPIMTYHKSKLIMMEWDKFYAFNKKLYFKDNIKIILTFNFSKLNIPPSIEIKICDHKFVIKQGYIDKLNSCDCSILEYFNKDLRILNKAKFYYYWYEPNIIGENKLTRLIKSIIPKKSCFILTELILKIYRGIAINWFSKYKNEDDKFLSCEFEDNIKYEDILCDPNFSLSKFISNRVYDENNYYTEKRTYRTRRDTMRSDIEIKINKPKYNFFLELHLRIIYLFICGRNGNIEYFGIEKKYFCE